MTHRSLAFLTAALVAAAPGLVGAQPRRDPPKTEQARREQAAQEHFERGREFFQYGAYDEAIREYEAAFATLPLADFLFNIGQVHRTKGDRAKAIEYYRRYLALAPGGQATAVAEAHIKAMEAELAAEAEAEKARRVAAEAEAQRLAAAEEQRQRDADAKARATARQAADDAVRLAEARQRTHAGRSLRVGGLVMAGGGLLAGGASVYLGWRATSLYDQAASARGAWTDAHEQEVRDADTARTAAYVLAVSGGVLLVGGATLYVLGRSSHHHAERPATAVTAAPVPGGLTLILDGSF